MKLFLDLSWGPISDTAITLSCNHYTAWSNELISRIWKYFFLFTFTHFSRVKIKNISMIFKTVLKPRKISAVVHRMLFGYVRLLDMVGLVILVWRSEAKLEGKMSEHLSLSL